MASPWNSLRSDLAHAAILTDFDGTLSAIVADPPLAIPLPGVIDTLTQLACRAPKVAVISGRPISFLARFIPADSEVILSGLYGLETRVDGVLTRPDTAQHWEAIVTETVKVAREELPSSVEIEPKELALTLHYRKDPTLQAAIEQWARHRGTVTGLVMAESRCSIELNPPIDANKGTVVSALLADANLRHACFLGDDRGDIAAFDALEQRRSSTFNVCKIAVRSNETPQALLDKADLIIDGPKAAVTLLTSLL